MNGVLLLPTLNRIGLLKEFLKSYHETRSTIPTWILVDSEDFKKNVLSYTDIKQLLPSQIKIVNTGGAVTMGDKVRHCFNEAKGYKWIGLLNDDHYCITPEWDKKAEKLLDGINYISTNDGLWNFGTNPVGLTAWSTPLLEACQFPIFPKGINHWFIDNVWKHIGEATGCWQETLSINIEHRHAFIGKMEPDDTFKISQDQVKAQESGANFQKFMETDFKEVCKRINALRSDASQKAKFT